MNYFMGDLVEKNNNAEFNFAQGLRRFGDTKVGKVFLKDANTVKTYNALGNNLKTTKGIAMSGKTLRKTPFAVAGLGLTAYGGYKAKKTYDKYRPVIKVGRKLNSMYTDFLNRTGNN